MSFRKESSETLRSAVILHGLVHRSLRHTADSLRECVIGPLKELGPVDVFFHSWEVAEIHNPRGGEHGVVLDPAEVASWLREAQGVFEPQEAFDESVNWGCWFRNNPMRHCCGSEKEARTTLMNFRRALESQERAWRLFEEQKTGRYELVVATRADLKFLEELRVPEKLLAALHERRGERESPEEKRLEENADHGGMLGAFHWLDGHRPPLQTMLWLPRFHSWGGVNDRFVIGNEEGGRIWSQRVAFAEEWLEMANGESAEWLLMKWLEKNKVRVSFLDFTFQRIRANGQVAAMDRELKTAPVAIKKARGKERFLILTRETGDMAENLMSVLEPLGWVEVILDQPPGASLASTLIERRYIHLTDKEAAGYAGLMSESFPKITAWSRAFAHLARTMGDEEAIWFVEDDVAGDADSFAELVRATSVKAADLSALDIRTRHEDSQWPWWSYADGVFASPCRAFQPLCRLSGRLVRAVLDFQKRHQRLTFHEVLFASLAKDHGMTLLDWRRDETMKSFVADFHYRPDVESAHRGISHPVKDKDLHEAICRIPSLASSRRSSAACEGWSIFGDDYDFLANWCRKQGFKSVVEFGPGDSTLALLDAGCRVVSYEHDIGWLKKVLERFRDEADVEILHCPEGSVPDPPDQRPDLVLVDGPPFREGQKMSRLGPCEWALEVCGCFLLHDTKRAGERATLKEMEKRGMKVVPITTKKGLALVVDPAGRPELLPGGHLSFKPGGKLVGTWMVHDIPSWQLRIGDPKRPMRILTTAAGNIPDAKRLLEIFFPHADSEIHALGTGDGGAEASPANPVQGGRVHWYDGEAREILAWMIAGDGFWESFDFIHLAGAKNAPELLADACQVWSLLKPKGLLMIEATRISEPGLAAFRSVYQEQWMMISEESMRILVRKC